MKNGHTRGKLSKSAWKAVENVESVRKAVVWKSGFSHAWAPTVLQHAPACCSCRCSCSHAAAGARRRRAPQARGEGARRRPRAPQYSRHVLCMIFKKKNETCANQRGNVRNNSEFVRVVRTKCENSIDACGSAVFRAYSTMFHAYSTVFRAYSAMFRAYSMVFHAFSRCFTP